MNFLSSPKSDNGYCEMMMPLPLVLAEKLPLGYMKTGSLPILVGIGKSKPEIQTSDQAFSLLVILSEDGP